MQHQTLSIFETSFLFSVLGMPDKSGSLLDVMEIFERNVIRRRSCAIYISIPRLRKSFFRVHTESGKPGKPGK